MSATKPLAPHLDLLLTATQLLKDHEGLHSEFQIRWMMIARNGLTPYGCLKQTLMEIETRVLSLTEPDLTAVTSGHDDKPHRFSLRDRIINQRQADLIRELVILCEIAGKLKTSIGPLTRQRRYEFETELWTVRIKRMAAVDFITTGRLCRDTVELITTIPFPQRTAILTAILHPEHQELLIQECLNYEVQHHLFSFLLPNEVSFQNGN